MNTCVCCGEVIPEGRQVCENCEKGPMKNCTTCTNSIFDEVWGEYKCTVHKIRISKPDVTLCPAYAAKKKEKKNDQA